jgi:transcriptional/translational regulatory protein YebC/TACO1
VAHHQAQERRRDAKRGKVFTRIIKELTVAARDGARDPA